MQATVKRMVTSCPECETHFYVKPEQLAARKGFVRCGHCHHRFNANENMLPERESQAERELNIDFSALEKVRSVFYAEQQDVSPDMDDNTQETYAPVPLVDAFTSTPPKQAAIVDAKPEQHHGADANEKVSSTKIVDTAASEAAHTEQQLDKKLPKKSVKQAIQPAQASAPEMPASIVELGNEMHDTLALQESSVVVVVGANSGNTDFAKKDGLVQKKSKNAAIALTYRLLAAVLILFAIMQTLYDCRTAITSQIPQIKPYFEQACLAIGCVIELPKDITKINIDDSDLKEDTTYQGLIRVSATIINQATVNLAYPNLELTLTDEDNKPLLRRIFKPSEYLEKKIPVELGLPSNQETYVNLNVSAAGSAVVGYRLLPSYE